MQRNLRTSTWRTRLSVESVEQLYGEYEPALTRVRRELKELYRRRGRNLAATVPGLWRAYSVLRRVGLHDLGVPALRPQLDDVCCELVYLLIRKCRPARIVEISPCGGWSSCWMLSALRDNGHGQLDSYDLVDHAARNVPDALREGRWRLHVGDVRQTIGQTCRDADYLFVDSDHSEAFARWYVAELFPVLKAGALVSVDDVFHRQDPGWFGGEGRVLMDYLEARGIGYFTVAPAVAPAAHTRLAALRAKLGYASDPIHGEGRNPAVFFWWEGQRVGQG